MPSVTVRNASSDCGVAGIVPLTMLTLAIETSCPSNASGLAISTANVVAAGAGAAPVESSESPNGEVSFSTDSVRSRRCRPPRKPTRPRASITCPGVVGR